MSQNPYAPPSSIASESSQRPEIFGLGSIAISGLLGGPIAVGVLVAANFRALRLRNRLLTAIVLFVLAVATWLYIARHVPLDFLSQYIVIVPQALLWWLIARFVLGSAHAQHAAMGGRYRSVWLAIGIALLVSVSVRLALLLGAA